MDYIIRKTTHEVVASMLDGSTKVLYARRDERTMSLPTHTAKHISTETNCGLCEYRTEYDDDYDECDYDSGNMIERNNYSLREYLQPIRLKDLYSIFSDSEIEENAKNILLKTDIELKDVQTLYVYVTYKETGANGTYTEYRDFIVDKYAAEKWRKLSDKKKERLEDDFRYYLFNEVLPSQKCITIRDIINDFE